MHVFLFCFFKKCFIIINHSIENESSVTLELLESFFPAVARSRRTLLCCVYKHRVTFARKKGVNKAFRYSPNVPPAVSDVCVGCHVSAAAVHMSLFFLIFSPPPEAEIGSGDCGARLYLRAEH